MVYKGYKKHHWDLVRNWCDENPTKKMSPEQQNDVLINFLCGECPNKNEECHDCPIYRAYQNQISDLWDHSNLSDPNPARHIVAGGSGGRLWPEKGD
jgi:hypothetical protein